MIFNRERQLTKSEARREARRRRVDPGQASPRTRLAMRLAFGLLALWIVVTLGAMFGAVLFDMLGLW